jgi:hypothetical protein
MSVALDGAPYLRLCQTVTGETWLSTLKKCVSYLEEDTFIMLEDPTKPITIVICYEPKKTPEKNGVL